jgi:hypothetical protein
MAAGEKIAWAIAYSRLYSRRLFRAGREARLISSIAACLIEVSSLSAASTRDGRGPPLAIEGL